MKLLLVLFVTTIIVGCVTASNNIVYYEPELSLNYMSDIHPYAWAHRFPMPHYTNEMTPYSDVMKFDSFTDLQSHVSAKSDESKFFTQKPSLLEMSTYATATTSAMASARAKTKTSKSGFIFGSSNKGVDNDPSSDQPVEMHPNPSHFVVSDDVESGTGFKNNFRRAAYGLRRRRMPFTGNAETTTLNPFRRPNSFFNTPPDLFSPFQRFSAAVNPKTTDFGSTASNVGSAYGDYSSFGAQQFRRSVSDGMLGAYGNEFQAVGYPSPVVATGFAPSSPRIFPNVGAIGDSFTPYPTMRWDGEKFAPMVNPFNGGVSPYIQGMDHTFHDFYGAGGDAAGAAAGGAEAKPASGEGASPPEEQAPAAL